MFYDVIKKMILYNFYYYNFLYFLILSLNIFIWILFISYWLYFVLKRYFNQIKQNNIIKNKITYLLNYKINNKQDLIYFLREYSNLYWKKFLDNQFLLSIWLNQEDILKLNNIIYKNNDIDFNLINKLYDSLKQKSLWNIK